MYKRIFVLCQAAVSLAVREGVYKKLKDIFPDSQVKIPLVNGSDQLIKGTADVIMVLTQNNTPEDLRIATGAIPQLIAEAISRERPVVHIRKECDKAVVVDYDKGIVISSATNTLTWLAKNKLDYEYHWMRNIVKKKDPIALYEARCEQEARLKEKCEQEARVKAGWAAAADPALQGIPVPSRGLHVGRAIPNGKGLNEQIPKDLRQMYTSRKNITAPTDKAHISDGIFRIGIYDGTEMLFDKNLMLLFR